jgi:hypothetical protein
VPGRLTATAPSGAGTAPLTYEQDRYLARTRHQLSAHKNVRLGYEILGELDPAALAAALAGFVHRHDALRLELLTDAAGTPRQRVRPVRADEEIVTCQRVGSASADQFSRYASAVLSRDVITPWEPGGVRPFTFRLLRRDENHHALLATFQNIVFDGRSHHLFDSELWRDYQALVRGESIPRTAPSFVAAAERQRSRSGPEQLARSRASWRERLRFVARHPWTPPPGTTVTEDGALHIALDGRATADLREACERRRCTPMQWLVSCFVRAVAQCAGQQRLGLWTSMDTRGSRDGELVGMFAGTCPLTISQPGADPGTVLAEVRSQLLTALRHQQLTADDVTDLLLETERETGAPATQDIYLNLRRFGGNAEPVRSDSSLRVTGDAYPLRRITQTNSSALHLRCNEYRNGIGIDLLFDGRRVGRPLAQAIADRMKEDLPCPR